jgi:CO/xanthine dehydrogenase FAD-binding subunit
MILEYHRPETLAEALALLRRPAPLTLPMGGGAVLNQPSEQDYAVVDLQALGLNTIEQKGNLLLLGATLTLQALMEHAGLEGALVDAIQHEATYNLRQVSTLAGTLVAADGRSPFATAMLALDAQLTLLPGDEQIGLGDLLPLRLERLRQRLVTGVAIPLNTRLAYEYVARTPADLPIVCAAAAQWPSGRTRVALGGFGCAPVLALDGPEAGGAEQAAREAYSQAGDQWASAEYRQDVAGTLTRRCLEALSTSDRP